MSKIITFYSYKGGVGRSMALANIGTLLAKWNKKVLIVDFDLEAPGIESYFSSFKKKFNREKQGECSGVIDLIKNSVYPEKKNWQDGLLKLYHDKENISIDILPSGSKASNYAQDVQNLDWENLFTKYNLGFYLENLRNDWKKNYDFILVDSRTGLSDIGGICTIYLPDIITFLFTTNEISLNGSINIIDRVRKARDLIPFDRDYLITLPLPSRDESRTENKLAIEWHNKFSLKLDEYYKDWLPRDSQSSEVIDLLRIPYIPIWSFGDRLPVIEEGTNKIDSIGYIYDKVAKLINSEFDWSRIQEPTTTTTTTTLQENINEQKKKTKMDAQNYISERVDSQISWYGSKSRYNKMLFYFLTTLQIIIAALLPLYSFLEADSFLKLKDIFISASGVVIVIIIGLLNIGKYREKWMNYRKTSDTLKQEKYKFLTNSFPYEEDSEFNYKQFVKTAEEIFSNENMSWEDTLKNMKIENSRHNKV